MASPWSSNAPMSQPPVSSLSGRGLPALIGLQQMTFAIGAAIRVARINRRASREQRDSLCGSAVVLQSSELGIGVVQIATAVEIAGVVAAQVVAVGRHRAGAVSP